jgi:hypothetical protein
MRDGILSDESVMKMCAEFQPIPLGAVSNILNVKQIESKLPTKSKYPAQPPARPAFFGAMSNSMAKQMDPTNTAPMRNDINQQYVEELGDAWELLFGVIDGYVPEPDAAQQPEQGSPLTPDYEPFSPSVNPFAVQESFQQRGAPSPRSGPQQVTTPFGKRNKADVENLRSALADPGIAAIVSTTPGSHVTRGRAYNNIVRASAGAQNILSSIMSASPGSRARVSPGSSSSNLEDAKESIFKDML